MTPVQTIFSPLSGAAKKATYTGTAGTTAALPTNATAVWIIVTTDAFIEVGAGNTAAADTGMYLPAFVPVVLFCQGGATVSAVQVSAAGTLYATPIA